MKLSRRSLVTAGVATGLAGLGAVGGGIVWKKLQTPDTNPAGTIAGIDPRVGVGANPAPTMAPITEAAAIPTATEISLTATTSPLPTETPTIIPSPTVTPTEAPPTPPKEALRYNGTLSFEGKSLNPESVPFDYLVLNPIYSNAQEALKKLILEVHTGARAASPTPGNAPLQTDILSLNPYKLEQEMKEKNITYTTLGHHDWKEDSPPRTIEIDPAQGLAVLLIISDSMLDQATRNHRYAGNAYVQETLQFRFFCDPSLKRLTMLMIEGSEGLQNSTNQKYIKEMGAFWWADKIAYGFDLLRYPDRLGGKNRNLVPQKEYNQVTRAFLYGPEAPANAQADGKYIAPWYVGPNRLPLLVSNR